MSFPRFLAVASMVATIDCIGVNPAPTPECGDFAACAYDALPDAGCGVACNTGVICDLNQTCTPLQYDVSDAGTVSDVVTGLVWQRGLPAEQCPQDDADGGSGCTWQDAQTYCENLQLGGFDGGWKLPTIEQLFTLFDVQGPDLPDMDSRVFTGVLGACDGYWGCNAFLYWSSTPVTAPPQPESYLVDFSLGGGLGYSANVVAYSVKCVH